MALTDKRLKFIEEYVKDWNGTQAAIRAGYSEKTAYSIANEILKLPEIQEGIKKHLPDENEVIGRIAAIARGQKPGVEIPHELRALELLGKAHGLFVDRQQVTAELNGGLVFLPGKDNPLSEETETV